MNEEEIAGAVGSAALQQRRRGAAGLWLSLERRGRMHLLLCADLVRFYREEAAAAAAEAGPRDGEHRVGGGGSAASTQADGGGGEAGGKRKPAPSATQDSGSSPGAAGGRGSARKRPRATDPWEDILAALNPKESLVGRSSSVPGSGSGRCGGGSVHVIKERDKTSTGLVPKKRRIVLLGF